MKIIKDTVGDDKKDWKQRMDNVRVASKPSLFAGFAIIFSIHPLALADEKTERHRTRRRHELRKFSRVPKERTATIRTGLHRP
jgi:hypothetical protein